MRDSNEHASSYYAATRNYSTDYPTLRGEQRADVVEVDRIEKRFGAGAADIARRMGLECLDIVVERINKHSIDCDLKFGYLDLALCQADIDYFHETIEEKQRTNYPHECHFVSKAELHDYIGSDIYTGGLVNSGNGHLHPLNLCIGEAGRAWSQDL